MNKSMSKIAGLALASVVILGGLTVAQAANADPITTPYQVTLYGASPDGGVTRGPAITSGNASDPRMFYGISVNATCPAGFKNGSVTALYQAGSLVGALSLPRDASVTLFGATGLTPANVNMSDVENAGAPNLYVNDKSLSELPALANGPFEIRYYCAADTPASIDLVNDKWFGLTLNYTAATGAWSVPVAAENTTVSLTAGATASDVTLTGTVKNSADATATAATGTVQFFELPNTTTPVATAPVVNGVASASLLAQPDGYHQYQAKYVSTDPAYNPSALSGTASVTIGSNTAQSTITVEIPSNVGALILSGVPASVDLGTAALNGAPGTGTLDASGNLNGVTVTDTRQLDFPAWSLTGQVGDFTKTGGGTLLGKYLGWAPSKVSGPASSVAGAAVLSAPGTTDGISGAPKSFATGAPDAAGTVSVFNAALNLKAPANTPAGSYSALLTITLA